MDKKIARIQTLKDEVNELHPLLKRLLPLLPSVSRVEYTHGTSEKGADFLVARFDEITGGDEYVGIIAKSNDIRQNFDDIERQIKECSMPRAFDGGRKKIILSEIWVVVSGGISANAQEKINHQFADKKIKFIWDERLASLVDKHLPTFWSDVDANIGYYLGTVSRHVDDLIHRTGIIDASMCDFYVEQDLARVELDPKRKFSITKNGKSEQLHKIVSKERFVLVEAAMGFGKSRLLRQCAKELASNEKFSDTKTLPVFLSFRDFANEYEGGALQILEELKSKHQIEWERYPIIFFIDGVDEVRSSLSEKTSAICNFVHEVNAYTNIKVVFASRPFDDPILEQQLDQHLTRYTLQPLTIQRIVRFVERICKDINITNKLRNDLQKSDLFRSLPRSPISAILLGRVLSTDAKELPSSLPELYSKYFELAFGRWDIQKGKISEKDYETTAILVRQIAKYMLDNDTPELPISGAERLISDYLGKRETGILAKDALSNLLMRSEILVEDKIRGVLFFRHRSFVEYIYAEEMHRQYGMTATIPSPFDPYWGAVIYFYLGRLKDCPTQLESLFSLVPQHQSVNLLRLVNAGNYLLASYQSPYGTICNCVKQEILGAARNYYEICKNPTNSALGGFSEIALLALFTGLLRNAFEYDFFKHALTDIETELLLSADQDQCNAIAAFFTSSIRAGLGCKDAFQALVDEHYAFLPLPIRLGVTHAAEDASFVNDAVKRLQKKITRTRRQNRGMNELVLSLYDVPLIERKAESKVQH